MPFIADYISILQNSILQKFEEKYSRGQALDMYTQLNSAYNLPNIVFPVVGGLMNDKYGYRATMLFYQANLVLGQALITVSFWLVDRPYFIYLGCTGRFLLGMSDSIEIPTFSMLFHWFDQNESMTASSQIFLFMTITQMLTNYYLPKIVFFKDLNFAMGLAVVVTWLGMLAAVVLVLVDKYKQKAIETQNQDQPNSSLTQLSPLFWVASIATSLPFSIYFSFQVFQVQLIEIQLLKHLPGLSRYELIDQETQLTSLVYLVQIPLFPLLGHVLDKYGQRIRLMYLGIYSFFFSLLMFDKWHPVYSAVLNGIYLALNISVSRCIFQFIVKKNQIGVGLGLVNSFVSLLIVVFNVAAGEIFKDENNQYCNQNCILLYYALLVAINIVVCHLFGLMDRRRPVSLDSNQNAKLQALISDPPVLPLPSPEQESLMS